MLRRHFIVVSVSALAALTVHAVVPPRESALRAREFSHRDLPTGDRYLTVAELRSRGEAGRIADLETLGVPPGSAFLDPESGRWGTLIPARPLLPGSGAGNSLGWNDLGEAPPPDAARLRSLAWEAFVGFLQEHSAELRIDIAELTRPGYVTVHGGGELIQIHAPRVVDGVPVRDSYLTAVVNHGNLVLFGAVHWGDVETASRPALSATDAKAIVSDHFAPLSPPRRWRKSSLAFVPLASGDAGFGEGLDFRLVWVLKPSFAGELGNWEGWVDAHSGELLRFADTARYGSTREVEGGVLPLSNDGIEPDGVEQPDFPMPFSDLTFGAETAFTDTGGNLLQCVDGEVKTTLSGSFVHVNDGCGAIDESTAGPVLDLGLGEGTDCMVPPGASAGNTRAARTVFYEVNRIQEMARGQLPGNLWLRQQLIANTNIAISCGALWNGTEIGFYRSGACANTGELAGAVDHEWGHGMDDNDAAPSISNPGEGIADVYAYLRHDESCIGRGFRFGVLCNGYGDPCTECTGVRELDWAKRESGAPHDLDWADAVCGSGGTEPCGGSSFCEGAVYAEAIFDLVNRDLPAVNGMDHNTALEVGTRLTYLGGGLVGTWFQCAPPFGGCNADGGYLNFLAVDDDNGDLGDGTPHMQAIFDAFDRHQIACSAPSVRDGDCIEAPASAPVLIAAFDSRSGSRPATANALRSTGSLFRSREKAAPGGGTRQCGRAAGR